MADRVVTDRVVADHRLSQISTASSTNSKRAKTHIGPWQLGRTLGRGSSGRVRLAKHMETGKLAAVKIVPKAQIMDQATTTLTKASESYGIEREVIIMKLIEHPNIMALYDVWENKGELYLVLEYIEGGELFDYLISRGRLSEREAIHYFRQICYGVDYCHRFNICHRDLKPENLLLDKHRNIKIADFGMAALESNGRLLETSCGSPHYASPEIVTGKTYHGAPSDIWSCGIILFALLSGHLPFDDDNIRQLLLKVQAGKYEIPSSLSPEAKDLISKMLVVDPKKRITMPEILRHPLLLKHPPRRVPPENLDRRLPKVDVTQPITRVDREILRNLLTLWHHDTKEELIARLRAPEPNAEKTFYSLLLRFRQRHGLASRESHSSPPRNMSVASIRSIRSSKSVRSVASLNSKSGSMRSLKSVRSNKSNRSMLSGRRTRKSPVKQTGNSSNRTQTSAAASGRDRNPKHIRSSTHHQLNNENADVFAQLLDEAFNRNSNGSAISTITNAQAATISIEAVPAQVNMNPPGGEGRSIEGSVAPSASNTDLQQDATAAAPAAGTYRASSGRAASSSYANRELPSSAKGSLASSENRRVMSDPVQSLSLDFDFSGHSYPPASHATHNYLLPMIFEEDRFADAIEEEVELKVYKSDEPAKRELHRKEPSTLIPKAREQAGDNSQLRITNLVAGESFLSYQPSPAAATVSAPVRPAPRAPNGPRTMPERKPVPIYVEEQAPPSSVHADTQRRPLATLTAEDLKKPRGKASQSSTAPASSSTTKEQKVKRHDSSGSLDRLHVPKRGSEKPSNDNSNNSKNTANESRGKQKSSWIRKLTPRIMSRKSSKPEAATIAKADLSRNLSANHKDKENVYSQNQRDNTGRSTSKPRPRASISEEPQQNWFMKLLATSSQVSSRTLISTCQPIELRAIILEVLSEWMPHGLALYSEGARGEPIVVAILQNNSLKLKPARIGIEIKPSRLSTASAKIIHQKGSRGTFMAFTSEMERRLGECNALGVN